MKSGKFDFANAVDQHQRPFFNVDFENSPIPNALEINLKTGAMVPLKISDRIMNRYIGGRALATRLFAEYSEGSDPVENPIIIASSPMNNTLTPYSDCFSIAFQSPVTGRFTVFGSMCRAGNCMRTLGLDVIIILNSSSRTVTISISDNHSIRIEEGLGGMTTSAVDAQLRGSDDQCIIVTGPAADNGAPFAAPVCEGNVLGRGGLGMLMMKKNLKAIVFTPDSEKLSVPLKTKVSEKKQKRMKALERMTAMTKSSCYLGKNEFNMMVKGAHAGFIPICNFNYRTDPRAFYLLSKRDIKTDIYRRRTLDSPLLSHGSEEFPYSQLSMLGANLGCFDITKIQPWISECIELGLDPVSAGNIIGWALSRRKDGEMEDYPELDDLSKRNILRIINRLANPRGRKLYGLMALGAKATIESNLFDSDHLYQIKGLECGPYDYRGYRSMSIEDYFGYQITCPCEPLMPLYDDKPRRLAKFIVWNNNLAEGLESAGFSHLLLGPMMCERESFGSFFSYLFPSVFLRLFNPSILSRRMREVTGKKVRTTAFRDLGKACYLLESGINKVISTGEPQMPSHFQTDTACALARPQVLEFIKLLEFYQRERFRDSIR